MNFFSTLRIAARALAKNKMRAILTILGVVIGIAAVTTMVSIGESASKLVQSEFASLGTNIIVVQPQQRRRHGVRQGTVVTLNGADNDAIARECPSVLVSSPLVGAGGQAIIGNMNWSPREITGVGADFLVVRNWGVVQGGFFTEREITTAAKVCVIGQTIVAKLFQTTSPIGKQIRLRNIPFEVVGVLQSKGANLLGEDQDDVVLIPYTTVQSRLQRSGFNHVHALLVSAKSQELMADAQMEITQLLLDRHKIKPGEPADFIVQNTTEIAESMSVVTGIMTAMLASIAGISLLVGGVGIMNIMLVSVTERTREIGIRMAVGARSQDILRQFLVESVLLSCVGGFIGLALGIGASFGVTTVINSFMVGSTWPVVISIPAAIVAILFAAAVGVFFGYYPALKASRLDPIDALRYE